MPSKHPLTGVLLFILKAPHPTLYSALQLSRVKSGIFGQTAKFGQPPSLYHCSIIEIKRN